MNSLTVFFARWFCLAAACIVFVSCDIFQNDDSDIIPLQEGTYAGIYSQGFEDSVFNPCANRDEAWQLMIEDTTFFAKFSDVGENPVYMQLRGTPSEKGEFRGFFATYDRQFTVEEVVRVTSREERDC